MKIELKPCPFCGGKADFSRAFHRNYVYCTECEAHGTYIEDTKEKPNRLQDAIDAWNRRENLNDKATQE